MKNILLGFKLSMAVIYTAIGVYLITHPHALIDIFSADIAMIMGIILILFGAFRGYRAWFIERNM